MNRSQAPGSIAFVNVGDAEFAVISVPITPEASAGSGRLTESEAQVLAAILAGKSNREIAAERRTSIKTVSNQVASLFKKQRVTSRAELVLQQLLPPKQQRRTASR